MKFEFYPTFTWADGNSVMDLKSFEAESADEVCEKVKAMIEGDEDALYSQVFYLCTDRINHKSMEFEYEVERRGRWLKDEMDEMFSALRRLIEHEKLFK